jgi:hypothetical protein
MSTLQDVVTVASLASFAVGVHHQQSSLERWDRERRFND